MRNSIFWATLLDPDLSRTRWGRMLCKFLTLPAPAIRPPMEIRQVIRSLRIHRRSDLSIDDIAKNSTLLFRVGSITTVDSISLPLGRILHYGQPKADKVGNAEMQKAKRTRKESDALVGKNSSKQP